MAGHTTSTSADRLKGSVKEAIGKLTGDKQVTAEGRRQKRDARPLPPAGPEADGSDRS